MDLAYLELQIAAKQSTILTRDGPTALRSFKEKIMSWKPNVCLEMIQQGVRSGN